jgi:hypothetical protein
MLQQTLDYSEARGYNLGVAREIGLDAAVVYNQLVFWQKTKPGEWFYKSYAEMEAELPLSEYQLRKAYAVLNDRGFIKMAKFKANGAPTLHFKVVKRFRMESEETSVSMDTEKTSETINNKTPIKNNTGATKLSEKDALRSKQAAAVYELYVRCFKLPDGADVTDLAEVDRAKKRYKFTDKRKAAVKRRLEDAGFKMLCAAVVGFSRDPFYKGQNDREWVADLDIFICRNYEKVEEGANKYEKTKNVNANDPWADL